MGLLFDRRAKVTIANPVASATDFRSTTTDIIEVNGGKTDKPNFPGMRIRLKIEKSLEKAPNTSEIIITNLSPSRRASLQQKGVKVLLEAGYKDTVFRLFSGDVRSVDHVRNGPDWDTTIKLGDGERAWQFSRVDESFAPGTKVADALKTLARAMGLGTGNIDKQAVNITRAFDQGYAVMGGAARALDKLVTAIGKEWSIQDGELQILDPYQTLDLPIPEIAPTSGLIGSPEMGSPATKKKPALLRFKSLIFPARPGAKVKLKSERYDGYVRIHKVSYDGDTHGGPWYVTCDASVIRNSINVDVVSSA
jgi:hypothetical protein